jgi:AAA family ATP:ADP antiporter
MLLAQAARKASAHHMETMAYIGQFKAHYFLWVNGIGLVLQMFIVSRVIKHAGLGLSLIAIPLASLGSYGCALLIPLIDVMFVGRVVESSLDYSLSNTTQQSLWLVTTREAKYKAKQVIDTLFRRAGDAISGVVVFLGPQLLGGISGFLIVNIVASMFWVILALLLAREYRRQQMKELRSDFVVSLVRNNRAMR